MIESFHQKTSFQKISFLRLIINVYFLLEIKITMIDHRKTMDHY